MSEFTFTTQTPSAKLLINVKTVLTSTKRLIKFEKQHFCQPSCHNYNNKWSCPPHNLTFSQYAKGYPCALVALFYCHLDQITYVKTLAMKKRIANTILRSRLNKLMRQLEKNYAGRLIANNSCGLCKPCTRKSKSQSYCKKPQEMRYSLDSLGLNVTEMSLALFDHQTARHNQKVSLNYATAAAVLLLKHPPDESTDQIVSTFLSGC
ncbi:DUF2284 domain-containing protein [Peptococcaceae bacterium 1198_IL3148]